MSWWQFSRRRPGSWMGVFFIWTLISNALLLYCKVFYRYFGVGHENIPHTGACIYAVNHQSHLDAIFAGILVKDRPFASMARSTLFLPPFGWMVRATGAIPIRRGESDRGAIRDLLAELKAGRCVFLFPEGTRSADGTVRAFKNGVSLLARRSGVPVIPLAVEGGADIFPRSRKYPRLRGWGAAKLGEPIPAECFATDEGIDQLRHSIEEMRLELRAEIRRRSNGAFPPPGPADESYWEREARE